MNSIEEIKAFIITIPCGEPIFNIKVNSRYANDVQMQLTDWIEREQLTSSEDNLKKMMGYCLERSYDISSKTLKINIDRLMPQLHDFIQDNITKLATETSLTDKPKRTNAYKEIVEIAYIHKRDEIFINDVLPIINYYNKSKTDNTDIKIHMNNVQALFNILRKKYGKSISKK